jgi:hypothetical protein
MINFTLQEHDIKAFAKRVLELPLAQGAAYKKIKLIGHIGFFCLILGIYLHWSIGGASPWLYSAVYLLSSLLILMPVLIKHYYIPRQTVRIYKKVFANHKDGISYTVKADENSLSFKTPRSESILKWGPEIKVFEDSEYILIFLDPQQALIINRSQVEGDLSLFMNTVKSQLKCYN